MWELCDPTGVVRGELDKTECQALLLVNAADAVRAGEEPGTYGREAGSDTKLTVVVSWQEEPLG